MKIILIQPKVGFQGASYWEPLGLGYIAAYLKQHKPELEIEVFSQAFDSDETIMNACANADMIGFGCTTPQLNNALELTRRIKLLNPGVYAVFGGYHPTALPFETKQYEGVDKVIIGEGEEGMLATVNGNRMNVLISEPLQNLDLLPYPDRDLIKAKRHVELAEKETGQRTTSIQASRGCPFQCLPCSNIKVHGLKIRVRTAGQVIHEMATITPQLKLDFIKFCDATFNTSIERVLIFSRENQRIGSDIPWGANIHPAIGNKEMFQEMKAAKCKEVWIGVESGSPKILKELRKGVTVNRIKQVFQWTKEVGLIRRAYFLIGAPSENMDDIKLTEKLAQEIDAEVYGFTILCPFPGTDLYDPVKYKDADWSKADEYGNSFYRNKTFSNEELWQIRAELADKFRENLCWRLQEHD